MCEFLFFLIYITVCWFACYLLFLEEEYSISDEGAYIFVMCCLPFPLIIFFVLLTLKHPFQACYFRVAGYILLCPCLWELEALCFQIVHPSTAQCYQSYPVYRLTDCSSVHLSQRYPDFILGMLGKNGFKFSMLKFHCFLTTFKIDDILVAL